MRTVAGPCLQSCTSKLQAAGPSCPAELTESCWSQLTLCWLRDRGPGQPRSQGFRMRTRRGTRKPWSGPVTWRQKMAVFDSYSSRSGEIFFNEIYKSSKQINSQKTSQSILFMCRATFGMNQLKSLKTPSMFSKIYRYLWRFSTTGKLSCILIQHTKFAFSRLEQ
jgi:hypothetical protein